MALGFHIRMKEVLYYVRYIRCLGSGVLDGYKIASRKTYIFTVQALAIGGSRTAVPNTFSLSSGAERSEAEPKRKRGDMFRKQTRPNTAVRNVPRVVFLCVTNAALRTLGKPYVTDPTHPSQTYVGLAPRVMGPTYTSLTYIGYFEDHIMGII